MEGVVNQLDPTQKPVRSLCDPVILPACLSTGLLQFLSSGDEPYACVLLLRA